MWNMWFTSQCENCLILQTSKGTPTPPSLTPCSYLQMVHIFNIFKKNSHNKFPAKEPSVPYQTEGKGWCKVSQWLKPSSLFLQSDGLQAGACHSVFEEGYSVTACNVTEACLQETHNSEKPLLTYICHKAIVNLEVIYSLAWVQSWKNVGV